MRRECRERFPPPPRFSDPDMHHGTCVTHVSWCMPGSLTNGFLWSRWQGKRFPAFPAHVQPAILHIWQETHAFIIGLLIAYSRVFFTGAQDGNFPALLAMINYKRLTPAPAIIATVGTTWSYYNVPYPGNYHNIHELYVATIGPHHPYLWHCWCINSLNLGDAYIILL